jgi:hypothetical protein
MVCLLAVAACAQAPDKAYEYYLTGNAGDVKPATRPGFVLMGGGKDVDAAFRWLVRKSGGGDVVYCAPRAATATTGTSRRWARTAWNRSW